MATNRSRGHPTRIVWGDALDQYLDIGYPLDEARAFSAPREGSEWGQVASGYEDAWIVSHDQLLKATARWIPRDGTVLIPTLGRRHSGWEDVDGWRAFLQWARGSGIVKPSFLFYPDARNTLSSARMDTDSNADGLVDGWVGISPYATKSFDAVDKAQRIDVNAGGNASGTTQYVNTQAADVAVLPGEMVTLSAEHRSSGMVNGVFAYLQIAWLTQAKALIQYSSYVVPANVASYARFAVAAAAPGTAAFARCCANVGIPANTGTNSAGSIWFRNAALERGLGASGAAAYVDQPGSVPVYLLEPMRDAPEAESDFTRRVPFTIRRSDGLPFTGY